MAAPEVDPLAAFGPKPGAKPADAGYGESEDEFEAAASDAFPELADDPARMSSFKQALQACVREEMKAKGTGK